MIVTAIPSKALAKLSARTIEGDVQTVTAEAILVREASGMVKSIRLACTETIIMGDKMLSAATIKRSGLRAAIAEASI